jgi:predicted nucleotidyltransferase
MSEPRIPDANLAATLGTLLDRASPPGLVSAYLFGSHAEGRAHRESDVDVAVLAELRRNLVDVVVLNDAPPGLGRRIVTAGIRVFCRDRATDHAFVRNVQLRAADLEPFLRRARRVKLTALRQ